MTAPAGIYIGRPLAAGDQRRALRRGGTGPGHRPAARPAPPGGPRNRGVQRSRVAYRPVGPRRRLGRAVGDRGGERGLRRPGRPGHRSPGCVRGPLPAHRPVGAAQVRSAATRGVQPASGPRTRRRRAPCVPGGTPCRKVGHACRRPQGARLLEAGTRAHLRLAVRDRQLRRQLTPDYRLGCKRLLTSSPAPSTGPCLSRIHPRRTCPALSPALSDKAAAWRPYRSSERRAAMTWCPIPTPHHCELHDHLLPGTGPVRSLPHG